MDPCRADPLSETPAGKPEDALAGERQSLERERVALRIQAAAVAAQQAALIEQERQIQQRQQEFERQQEQLAAHLDARRQQILALEQRVQQGRDELRSKQQAQQQEIREHHVRFEQAQSELAQALQGVKSERNRLLDLRKRLKRRFHRQWAGERTRLDKQEESLAKRHAALSRQIAELQREREQLAQERLRVNGDRELGGRRVQDAWRRLHETQKAWKAQCGHDRQQLQLASAELSRLRAGLQEAEQNSSDRRRQAEEERDRLAKEAEGLEQRVINLRRKLVELEHERGRLEEVLAELRKQAATPNPAAESLAVSRALIPVAPPVAVVQTRDQRPMLEALGKLMDGRSHLLEQCLQLVRAWELWQGQHEAATAELAHTGQRIAVREDDVARRERALEGVESDLRRRHAEVMKMHHHCESLQARLRTGEAALRAERETLLARVHSREAHAEHQAALIVDLRRRWIARHRQELDALRAERGRCQDTQRRYAELCEETLCRNQTLERQARDLALRALSLEEYRLHFIATADNAATTERRLERLRQRWDKRFAAAEGKLARDAATLTAALNGLDEHMDQMAQLRDELAVRQDSLDRDLAAWEHEQALAEIDHSHLEADRESHQVHRQALERQLGEERAELERVMHTLLVEGSPLTAPMMRAA